MWNNNLNWFSGSAASADDFRGKPFLSPHSHMCTAVTPSNSFPLLYFNSTTDGECALQPSESLKQKKKNLKMLCRGWSKWAELTSETSGARGLIVAPRTRALPNKMTLSNQRRHFRRVESSSLLPTSIVNVRPNWQWMWFLITLIFSKSKTNDSARLRNDSFPTSFRDFFYFMLNFIALLVEKSIFIFTQNA